MHLFVVLHKYEYITVTSHKYIWNLFKWDSNISLWTCLIQNIIHPWFTVSFVNFHYLFHHPCWEYLTPVTRSGWYNITQKSVFIIDQKCKWYCKRHIVTTENTPTTCSTVQVVIYTVLWIQSTSTLKVRHKDDIQYFMCTSSLTIWIISTFIYGIQHLLASIL